MSGDSPHDAKTKGRPGAWAPGRADRPLVNRALYDSHS